MDAWLICFGLRLPDTMCFSMTKPDLSIHAVRTLMARHHAFKEANEDIMLLHNVAIYHRHFVFIPFVCVLLQLSVCSLQGKLKCIKDRSYDLFTQVRYAKRYKLPASQSIIILDC